MPLEYQDEYQLGGTIDGMVVSSDGAYTYVTSGEVVYKIANSDMTLADSYDFVSGHNPNFLAINVAGTYLYAACSTGDHVEKIQTSDMTLVDTAVFTAGYQVYALTIDAAGDYCYATTFQQGNVSKVRTSDMAIIDTCELGVGTYAPARIAWAETGHVYVISNVANEVGKIQTSDMTFVDSCTGFESPAGVGCSPSGDFVYVSEISTSTDRAYKIRTSDMTVDSSVLTARQSPSDLQISRDGVYLHINATAVGEYGIDLIDTRTMRVEESYSYGTVLPKFIDLSNDLLYVSTGDNKVKKEKKKADDPVPILVPPFPGVV